MTNKRKALQIALDRLTKQRCEYEFIESMLKAAFEDGDVIEHKGEQWHVIGFYVAEYIPYVQMARDNDVMEVHAEDLVTALEKNLSPQKPNRKNQLDSMWIIG